MLILSALHSRAPDLPDYIAAMDEKTRQIDLLPTHEVKKALLTGTDGGGTLSAFRHEGQIRHLKITIGLSNRQVENNYYYENDQLVFASSKQSFFLWDDNAQKLNLDKIATTLEDAYYFVEGKLTHWNTNRAAADLSNQHFKVSKESETVLQESSFFMQTARDEKDSVSIEGFIKRGVR